MNTRQEVYLTREGIAELKEELEDLVKVKRPALAKRLRKAIQQGDLSENADYQAAKEAQGFLEGRIQQIEGMLRRAVIIESNQGAEEVQLGSHVRVVEEGFDDPEAFYLVGPAEADPGEGKISHKSPLGRALMGHRVGDTVRVEAPAGEIKFQIVGLE
jgi:transcription elongation factor GreA